MSTKVTITENYQWANEHNNVNKQILRRYQIYNTTGWKDGLKGIQEMLGQARNKMERVRSYGGKWSLSDVAVCNDNMHDTKPLTFWAGIGASNIDGKNWFADKASLDKRLFYFQSGAQIAQINIALEKAGFSLPTTGASNGQTLAGAVSTGTHGSALKIGAMQDFVRALHIITGENEHFILQPKTDPIVKKGFSDIFGAVLLNDDELFYAALVSFGSFGVIHGLIIETLPLFQLETYCIRINYSQAAGIFPLLANFKHDSSTNITSYLNSVGIKCTEDPHHVDLIANPYSTSNNVYLRAMFKRPYDPQKLSPEPGSSDTRVGDDILSLVGGIADSIGAAVPVVVNQLFKNVAKVQSGFTQTPRNIFGDSTVYHIKKGGASVELGVPVSQAKAAVDAVFACVQSSVFAGFVGIRFVKNTKATIGFTRFAPLTCTIELPAVNSEATHNFYKKVFAELDNLNIPFTLHWGQEGDYSPQRLSRMYGAMLDKWIQARKKFLPDSVQRYMFTNDFLKQCGINEAAPLTGGTII